MKKEFDFCNELVRMADSDLGSAKLLHENKRYPQAVSSFQQSVEKLNKAIGLMSKNIKKSELINEIGHKSIRVHERLLKAQKRTLASLSNLTKEYESLSEMTTINGVDIDEQIKIIQDFLRDLEFLQKNPVEIANMSESDILDMVVGINQTHAEINKLNEKEENIEITEKNLINLKESVIKSFSSLKTKHPKEYDDIIKRINLIDLGEIKDLASIFVKLIIKLYPVYFTSMSLAILTIPHSNTSRYPDELHRHIPLDVYTEDLSFIKVMPELFKIQERAIIDMQGFNTLVESNNITKSDNLLKAFSKKTN